MHTTKIVFFFGDTSTFFANVTGLSVHLSVMVHRSNVGSIVADCVGAHLARGKVKSVEHALSWSLDSK